ncbi:MAG: AAA family ATPase [Alphaproteobacteria bacterium]|nr:AAA family ATPase [Alphaproteobacteria bacterium]
MRLRRFDLTRYGIFTDNHVDFGERTPGTPDFHVIYGPNESGKSTLFSAWLDFLYGIGVQSPFNFVHSYQAMRIGGILEFASGMREFVRIKRAQNSLLDTHDEPVGDISILEELGGIDRESYRTMFSLDDNTLEQGGDSILRAKGDLGQLLFSASSGLPDLSRRLGDLQVEAEKFYKTHARNVELQVLKEKLDQLKQEKERIDTQASKHAELIEASRRSKALYDETNKSSNQLQVRKEEIRRLLDARPRLAKLRVLQGELASLTELPNVPMSWIEELPALREEEIRFETETKSSEQEIERLESIVKGISVDTVADGLAEELKEICPLQARYITAEKDLPDRYQEHRELDLRISFLLQQIERETEIDPQRLVLTASIMGNLRGLIESYSGIETANIRAREELSDAKDRLSEAADKVDSRTGSRNTERETLLNVLKNEITTTQTCGYDIKLRLAERTCQEAQTALNAALSVLSPWSGTAEQLTVLSLPALEDLQEWKTKQQGIQKRIDHQAGEMERLKTETSRLLAQQEAVRDQKGVVTDQVAIGIREERDQAWAEHRTHLDINSADRFEKTLRHDDEITAQRFEHTSDLAQLREIAKGLRITQADEIRAKELLTQAQADAGALAQIIAEAIGSISPMLPTNWTLPQLESWLGRREKALEKYARSKETKKDLDAVQDDARAARDRLAAALTTLAMPFASSSDVVTLIAVAQKALDLEAEQKRFQTAWEEQKRDVSVRELAAESAEAKIKLWQADWQKICKECWLGEEKTLPTIAAVNSILPVTTELATILKEKAIWADRIDKMEKDKISYRDALTALAKKLGIVATDPVAVMTLANEIDARVQKAIADRLKKTNELERLKEVRAGRQKLEAEKYKHDCRKQEMTAFFGVSTLAEVSAKLEQAARRNALNQQANEKTQEILETVRLANFQDAEKRLDEADQVALEEEMAGIAAKVETLEQECRDSYAAYKDAEKQLDSIGRDANVAEIEEKRRTVLLEIEEGAQHYMRLRAGIVATEKALRLYREQHRSSMMTRASKAFCTISRGVYVNLTTQPDKENEIMVAVTADNSSKLATEMSKGTRFQLYLALRVAGYSEFARARSPVPFVADDIMETFDDFRAEEAFRLFAEMAEKGQVIYLTHHRHLCAIARKVCPTVKVHNLQEIGAGVAAAAA